MPKIGDLMAAAAGVIVFAQGVAEHLWSPVADRAFPFTAFALLVIFGAALSVQWRSIGRVAGINRTSGNALEGGSLAHVLGASLRIGAAPALWVAVALLAVGGLFGWSVGTRRLAIGASLLAIAILIWGLLHYVIAARKSPSNEEAPR